MINTGIMVGCAHAPAKSRIDYGRMAGVEHLAACCRRSRLVVAQFILGHCAAAPFSTLYYSVRILRFSSAYGETIP